MSERPLTGPTPYHDPILAAQLGRIEAKLVELEHAIQGKLGDTTTGVAGRQAATEADVATLKTKVAALEAAQATKRDKTIETVVNAGVAVLVALTTTMTVRTVLPDAPRLAPAATTQGGPNR